MGLHLTELTKVSQGLLHPSMTDFSLICTIVTICSTLFAIYFSDNVDQNTQLQLYIGTFKPGINYYEIKLVASNTPEISFTYP